VQQSLELAMPDSTCDNFKSRQDNNKEIDVIGARRVSFRSFNAVFLKDVGS
jgi:hypothetical protein